MMSEVEVEVMLLRWGRVYGEHRPQEWDESDGAQVAGMAGGFGNCVLAAAMEYAPGKAQRLLSGAWVRSRAALKRSRFSDPMPAKESRHFSGALYFSGAESSKAEPVAARVERAAMDLYRIDTQRGLVLRAHYCRRGTQREKVAWINGDGRATALTLRTYQRELAKAREWMRGRLA